MTERTIRLFLRQLATASGERLWEQGDQENFPRDDFGPNLDTSRVRPAEERCREAMRELPDGALLTPTVFARQAEVSVSTVLRLLKRNVLTAWRPTPRRPKICRWSEKERLTRKSRKSGQKAE